MALTIARQADPDRKQVANSCFLFGFTVLTFAAALLLWISLAFLAGFRVSPWHVPAAASIAALVLAGAAGYYFPDRRWQAFGWILCLCFLTVIASIVFSAMFYDLSWDGQSYHQEGIIQLARGWNPLQQPTPPERTNHDMELTYWAKGEWLSATAVYRLTGRIEYGKCFHILFITVAFALTLAALLRSTPIRFIPTVGIALTAALNPVSLGQCTSYYLDGQVSSLLVTMLALAVFAHPRWEGPSLVCLASGGLVLVNLKATALVYLVIFLAGYLVWLAFSRRKRESWRVLATVTVSIILGVGLVGYNPYLTNLIHKGHPFFPFAGKGAIYFTVLMQGQRPSNFEGANRFERLILSVFSQTENATAPSASRWKIPFSIHPQELQALREGYGTRVGGWGPLFGGAVLLSLLILGGAAITAFRASFWSLWAAGCVVASVLVTSEGWWARFAPQLYLLPVIAVVASITVGKAWLRHLGAALFLVLLANTILLGSLYLDSNYTDSRRVDAQLEEWAGRKVRIVAYFWWFRSNRIRLAEHGIPWREVASPESLPCCPPQEWNKTGTLYCTEPLP